MEEHLAGLITFVLAITLALAFYFRIIPAFFILDDFVWLESAGHSVVDPSEIFNRNISNFFRPLVHLYFTLLYSIFGAAPDPFHVASMVLHGLCAGLFAHLTWLLLRERAAAVFAGLTFALLPSYSEVLVWISAVTEPIYVAMSLASLIAWHHTLTRAQGWIKPYLLTFLFLLLALCSKEAAVSVLPLLILLHCALGLLGRTVGRGLILYLPFMLLLGAYLHFQHETQQVNYLVQTGMYAPGFHFVTLSLSSLYYLVGHAWIPLALSLVGLIFGMRRLARPTPVQVAKIGVFAALLLLTFFCVMFPYALFTGNVLASRYFYLPAMVVALAAALLGAPSLSPGAGWSRLFPVLGLAGLLAGGYGVGQAEVQRYQSKAKETRRFIWAARKLPAAKKSLILVDSLLQQQQLQAAMEVFHPSVGKSVTSVERSGLPDTWLPGMVWAWDQVSVTFHEIQPPRD